MLRAENGNPGQLLRRGAPEPHAALVAPPLTNLPAADPPVAASHPHIRFLTGHVGHLAIMANIPIVGAARLFCEGRWDTARHSDFTCLGQLRGETVDGTLAGHARWRCLQLSPLNVPKFVDLGGKRHPMAYNFPLSLLIIEVIFSLSTDELT